MVKLSIALSLILGCLLSAVSAYEDYPYDDESYHGPKHVKRYVMTGKSFREPSVSIAIPENGSWETLDRYLIDLLDHTGRTGKKGACFKLECRIEICALPIEAPMQFVDLIDYHRVLKKGMDPEKTAQMLAATRLIRAWNPSAFEEVWHENVIDIVPSASSGVNQTQINHYPWAAGYEGDPNPFGCTEAHRAYSARLYVDRYKRPAEDADKISFVIDLVYESGSKLRGQCVYGKHVYCEP